MATRHPLDGHDVVIPQLVTSFDRGPGLEEASATLHQIWALSSAQVSRSGMAPSNPTTRADLVGRRVTACVGARRQSCTRGGGIRASVNRVP